jgi:hypothetical protein
MVASTTENGLPVPCEGLAADEAAGFRVCAVREVNAIRVTTATLAAAERRRRFMRT